MRGRVGIPTHVRQGVYGSALYNPSVMNSIISTNRFSASELAQYRLTVLTFHAKYGTQATRDAYAVSKATIYRWKRRLSQAQGKLQSLLPHSRAPQRKRVMETHPQVVAFIAQLREDHHRLGKEKIKPLLDAFCREEGLPTTSVSTIGKVIKRHRLFSSPQRRIYHNPGSGFAERKRNYKTKIKHSPRPEGSGYLEIDTITRLVHGIRFYIFNAIDIKLKFTFSYGYSRLSSKTAVDFVGKLELVYPLQRGIKIIQTDNGLEYQGALAAYLKRMGIKHLYIYPRCPKINAFVERANRTLQEEFIDSHLEYLLEDLGVFNRKLMDYLVWYNTKRVHKSLENQTPIDYLLKNLPESHMYVTHTFS